MHRYIGVLIFGLFIVSCFSINLFAKSDCDNKNIYGNYEPVKLIDQSIELPAKLDTGAFSSSLNAQNISIFTKNGKKWVKFTFIEKKKNIQKTITHPIHRYAKIRMRDDEIKSKNSFAKRPVILLNVCLGNQIQKIEINLADRKRFDFPMLIGKKAIIKFNGLIDPSKEFTTKPSCISSYNK